jgi:putative hydrolase of the HAD superfamily
MIRALIFDLGRTLIPFDFERSYDRLRRLCPRPLEDFRTELRESGLVTRFESGQLDPDEFVREFCRCLGADIPYRDFCDIWSSIFLPETLIPEGFLRHLKPNYRLVLLSNTNVIHYDMLKKNYPILGLFDEHVLSFRVGVMKPAREIYQEAIRAAQCPAHQCFFTDDIPEYVEAARREGIDGVVFEGFEPLKQELALRGVRW